MKLFDLLANSTEHSRLTESSEYKFYESHKVVFETVPVFAKYNRVNDAFSLVQANIVIRGLINKLAVENTVREDAKNCVNKINKIKIKLPHFTYNRVDVYIPFLLPNHNDLYFKTPNKLLKFPYIQFVDDFEDSIVDCFDTYSYALFESNFTQLIFIAADATTHAYYHANLHTIFIVNNQGRADVTIHLFDRGIKHIETENIIKRLSNVVNHYYKNDKIAFVDALFMNRFISEKLYRRIYKSLKIA